MRFFKRHHHHRHRHPPHFNKPKPPKRDAYGAELIYAHMPPRHVLLAISLALLSVAAGARSDALITASETFANHDKSLNVSQRIDRFTRWYNNTYNLHVLLEILAQLSFRAYTAINLLISENFKYLHIFYIFLA